MLHIVNKSPFERDSLDSCLRYAVSGSTILLIEDGIYAALNNTSVADRVNTAMSEIRFCVLEADLEARGVSEKVMEGIEQVDYAGFVDLVTKSDKVQSWL